MTKRIFTLLTFVFFVSGSGVSAADPVASFKNLIATASKVTSWNKVWLNEKSNEWRKAYYVISDVEYDVRKTDSLVNPVIGIAKFTVTQNTSSGYATEQQAQHSSDIQPYKFIKNFDVKYQFSNKKWTVSDARYKSDLVGGPAGGAFGWIEYKPTPNEDKTLSKWFPGYYN